MLVPVRDVVVGPPRRVPVKQEGGVVSGMVTHDNPWNDPPANPQEEDIWLVDDGLFIGRRGASDWSWYGPSHPFTLPDLTEFSWVNQGGATANQTYGHITMYVPPSGGNNHRILVKSVPSTPYNVDLCFQYEGGRVGTGQWGMVLRESSTGKLVAFQIVTTEILYVNHWSSPSAGAGAVYQQAFFLPVPIWFRIRDDGVNHYFYHSADGVNWWLVYQQARDTYMANGGDQIGWSVNVNNGATEAAGQMAVLSWEEA